MSWPAFSSITFRPPGLTDHPQSRVFVPFSGHSLPVLARPWENRFPLSYRVWLSHSRSDPGGLTTNFHHRPIASIATMYGWALIANCAEKRRFKNLGDYKTVQKKVVMPTLSYRAKVSAVLGRSGNLTNRGGRWNRQRLGLKFKS